MLHIICGISIHMMRLFHYFYFIIEYSPSGLCRSWHAEIKPIRPCFQKFGSKWSSFRADKSDKSRFEWLFGIIYINYGPDDNKTYRLVSKITPRFSKYIGYSPNFQVIVFAIQVVQDSGRGRPGRGRPESTIASIFQDFTVEQVPFKIIFVNTLNIIVISVQRRTSSPKFMQKEHLILVFRLLSNIGCNFSAHEPAHRLIFYVKA